MSAEESLPRVMPVAIHVGVDQEHVDAGEAKYVERTVRVAKLPLGKAASLGLAFRSVVNKISEFRDHEALQGLFNPRGDGKEEGTGKDLLDLPMQELALELVNVLPELLHVAAEGVIEILAVGTGLESDELREVGLDEASELFLAIVAVNNLEAVQRNLKNVLGRLGLRKEP